MLTDIAVQTDDVGPAGHHGPRLRVYDSAQPNCAKASERCPAEEANGTILITEFYHKDRPSTFQEAAEYQQNRISAQNEIVAE